jgi:hypothetical protein
MAFLEKVLRINRRTNRGQGAPFCSEIRWTKLGTQHNAINTEARIEMIRAFCLRCILRGAVPSDTFIA